MAFDSLRLSRISSSGLWVLFVSLANERLSFGLPNPKQGMTDRMALEKDIGMMGSMSLSRDGHASL